MTKKSSPRVRTRTTVVLVGCGSKKGRHEVEAHELYHGAFVRKCIAYARRLGHPWVIVSALHGIVDPHKRLKPYNVSLLGMTKKERERWARSCRKELVRQFGKDARYIVLCGELYLACVDGLPHEAPMRGMTIGRRLAWLNERLPIAHPTGVRGFFDRPRYEDPCALGHE